MADRWIAGGFAFQADCESGGWQAFGHFALAARQWPTAVQDSDAIYPLRYSYTNISE